MEITIRRPYSTNHKDIGTPYSSVGVRAGLIGARIRITTRSELGVAGSLTMDEHIYNRIATAHAFSTIFSPTMPAAAGGPGNRLSPPIINSADMAFPRLNNLRF